MNFNWQPFQSPRLDSKKNSDCCFAFVIFTHVFVRSKIRNIQTFASVVYFIVNMDAVKTG